MTTDKKSEEVKDVVAGARSQPEPSLLTAVSETMSQAELIAYLKSLQSSVKKLEDSNKALQEKQLAQEKETKFLDACRGSIIAETPDIVVPFQESSERTILYSQWVMKFLEFCPGLKLINAKFGMRGTFFIEVSKNTFNADTPIEITLSKAITPPSNSRFWRYTTCHAVKWGGKADDAADFEPVNAMSPYFLNSQGLLEKRKEMPEQEVLPLPKPLIVEFIKAFPAMFNEAEKKMTLKLAKKVKEKEEKAKEKQALQNLVKQ